MGTTVLRAIEKRPLRFFDKLSEFYNFELVWSKTFRRWRKQKMSHRIKHLRKLRKLPGEINAIGNIIRCLDKYYPTEGLLDNLDTTKVYSYGNKTTVETAIIIWEFYGKKIHAHMTERFKIGKKEQVLRHNRRQAIKELIKRGFVPKEDVDLNFKLPYLYCTYLKANLVYPEQWDMNETYEKFALIGVSGFTGIKVPKSYRQ